MDVVFTEKLIQEVRRRPILYLLSHPDFKNNMRKLQAWRDIHRELNEDVVAMKAKWKNLKDTYKKYKQSKQNSGGQAAKKLQNWAWAEHMSFIDQTVAPNETQAIPFHVECDNNPTNSNCNSAQPHQLERNRDTVKRSEDTTQDNDVIQESDLQETQNDTQIYRRQIAEPTDRMIQKNKKRDRVTNDGKVDVKCDGEDLLYLGYADTFKKLSKRSQVKVKFEIARVLMEAELGDLDAATIENNSTTLDTVSPAFNQETSDNDYQARLMALKIYKLFCKETESHNEIENQNVREQVTQATGISNEDLDAILNDSDRILSKVVPKKRKKDDQECKNNKKITKEVINIEQKENDAFETVPQTTNELEIKCELGSEEDSLKNDLSVEMDQVSEVGEFEFEPIMKCEPENQDFDG